MDLVVIAIVGILVLGPAMLPVFDRRRAAACRRNMTDHPQLPTGPATPVGNLP